MPSDNMNQIMTHGYEKDFIAQMLKRKDDIDEISV